MEKRLYRRIKVGLSSDFIIKYNPVGLREFGGYIDDLSENGIKISITNPFYSKIFSSIKTGNIIAFQSFDEYDMCGNRRIDVFSGEAKVVRVDSEGENTVIGCKIFEPTQEYEEYVKNKKMSMFVNRGCMVV